VEFASELHDLLHTDMARHYPALTRFAKIRLYDVAPNILGSFDKSLAELGFHGTHLDCLPYAKSLPSGMPRKSSREMESLS